MNCVADALNKFAQKSPASQPGFFLYKKKTSR